MSDQIQCNGGQIKHNSNQIQLDPDAAPVVLPKFAAVGSGGLGADACDGYYLESGTEGGRAAYVLQRGTRWIWWSGSEWIISSAKGDKTGGSLKGEVNGLTPLDHFIPDTGTWFFGVYVDPYTLTVTGVLSPDVTGDYTAAPKANGRSTYLNSGSTYEIRYHTRTGGSWNIMPPGTDPLGNPAFYRISTALVGEYAAIAPYTGTATVEE